MARFYDGLNNDIKTILFAQIRNLWTHTSTAIEGNTLTLGDTAFLLDEGLTVSGKPLKDHEEVFGHAKAIELIYKFVELDKLTASDLFALHKAILTERITDTYKPIGNWKNTPNYTSCITSAGNQAWREFPSPDSTGELMADWLNLFNHVKKNNLSESEAIQYYAELHLYFVTIHPFFDGNGRMARLIANLPLLCSGFPPIVIATTDRYSYKKAISSYQETVASLNTLKTLSTLPDNDEKKFFMTLCRENWQPTLELVKEARLKQAKLPS